MLSTKIGCFNHLKSTRFLFSTTRYSRRRTKTIGRLSANQNIERLSFRNVINTIYTGTTSHHGKEGGVADKRVLSPTSSDLYTATSPPPINLYHSSRLSVFSSQPSQKRIILAPSINKKPAINIYKHNMYQPGSLSSLLAPSGGEEQTKKHKKVKQENIPTSSSGGLSNLFSDTSLQKFARVLKPEEFGAVRKKKEVGDDDDKDAKKAAKGPKKREGKKAKWDDAKRKERDEKKGSVGSVASSSSSSSSSVPSISDIKSDKKEKKRKAAEALDKDTNTTTNDSKGADGTAKKSKTDDKAVEAETETEQVSDTIAHDTSKDHLTAFFGNVPISETVKSIKKYCTQFGEVESVRLRSVPVAGTAVDDAGNQNLVRKVCANSRNFMEIKGSFNAYVVFTTEDAVTNSLRANNQLWGTRHLRVDRMKPTVSYPHSYPSCHPFYLYLLIIRLHFTVSYHCYYSCLIQVDQCLWVHYPTMRTKKIYVIILLKYYRMVILTLKEFVWSEILRH